MQGSYRQDTAIYTINDIDIIALCRLWQPGAGGGGTVYDRDRIFQIIAAPLMNDQRYRAKVHYNPTSMCVKADLGIKVEILPAVFRAGNDDPTTEPFRLYRPSSAQWEDGYARQHRALLSAKNAQQRTGGNFFPMIKVMKHLRSQARLDAVSFHLECLLYSLPDELFKGGPADYIPAVLGAITLCPADAWYSAVCHTPCGERDIFVAGEWPLATWREFHRHTHSWAAMAQSASNAATEQEAIRSWQILLRQAFFPARVA